MRRKGNEILFDSGTQKAEFEGTMSSSNPQFIKELMEIISSFQMARARTWRKIEEELRCKGELSSNEYLSYDWMQRKLLVEEVANNKGEEGAEGG